jgi:hypothetical protein
MFWISFLSISCFPFFSHHGDIENFIAILFDDGDGYLKNEFSLLSG